ncbi:MAG: hypothetical protein EU532_08820 [Promethearchaeota archaeon]|nr:MAG: hypothetical protein EU532_08820 [Candidatus Lokiarchaeota archaeon]
MAKKKWFAFLTNIFSKPNNTNHRNSRTTTRSPTRSINRTTSRTATSAPTRTVNHRTTRTTMRTPTRTVNRTTSRTTSRTTVNSNSNPMNRTRTTSTQTIYRQTKSNSKSVHRAYANGISAVSKKTYSLKKLRPRGTVLFKEDFKCIFCFQLPKLPEDENRGIVICPHCGHPAHADEFKIWLKSSRLCSRCDRPLSINFIRNMEIVPTKIYIKAMKIIMKKGRK